MARVDGFDWDDGNWPKCGRHGVSRQDIEHALSHGALIAPDPAHSRDEDRFIAVGRNAGGRAIFVAVTFRRVDGRNLVRPISARYMHAKEAKRYAAQGSQAED